MKRRIIGAAVSAAMIASAFSGFAVMTVSAAANAPKYQEKPRLMEELNRGLIAAYRAADKRSIFEDEQGVYLSWRLLGDESLTDQAFDIYRGNTKIHTTGPHDATNYIDKNGAAGDTYKVVKKDEDPSVETPVTASSVNVTPKGSEVGNQNSLTGSYTYVDIPIDRPDPVERMGDKKLSYYYTLDKEHDGGANDASVGDIDGDGDYEIILKWDPTDSKDTASADFTGNVYIDAYEIEPYDENASKDQYRLWRIDMGQNVTAGAHYTQFIVYDFDGDGKAEIAMKTAPGTIDGTGHYVTEVGDTDAIRNADNTKSYIGTSGRLKGKNPFTQYLTVFEGATGKALWTTEYIPYEKYGKTYWGDGSAKYNRSERYLAGVAYLDGVHPSIIMCRGYYNEAAIRAYNWDGSELTLLWEQDGAKKGATSIYGQGNHNLSVGDIDNDGKDEIVYGSVAIDDNGVGMGNTYLGHGDAMHLSDFNNDGIQEVFSVKEDGEGFKTYAEDLRVAATGEHFWASGKIVTGGDNGRGVMDNIDDAYALTHPNALALGWSSGLSMTHDFNGDDVAAKPASAGSGSFDNSLVYWDGDLGRELLDANIIQKYDAANGWTKRIYGPSDGYTLSGGTTNNYTKRNASLSADLWGDWREEIILPVNKNNKDARALLRIFTSTTPTDYRLTTLMHDSQYRTAIAWQNVGYNQPPHTSYYIGSAALATDDNGNKLNYLAPAVPYTRVAYDIDKVSVTGMTLTEHELNLEKNNTAALTADIEPDNATKKGIIWTSSDESVATVANGIVKGIGNGTAVITAETRDGGFKDTCTVTVTTVDVTGVAISDKSIELAPGSTQKLSAVIAPDNASDKEITWLSSDETVASVDENGTVTGMGYGKAKITALASDGIHKAICSVNVKPMQIAELNTDDVFISTTNTTDFTGTKDSAALALKESTNAEDEFHKDLPVVTKNTAELSFRFTTGGIKGLADGSNWNWTGHEYTLNVEFLDENENNILTLTQPYASKAGNLMSKIGANDAKTFSSDWKMVVDGLGNIQGSAKRWKVDISFDYANDTAYAQIMGTDSAWEANNGQYTKTFALNGAHFKTVKVRITKDGTGTVTASPTLESLTYNSTEAVSGNAEGLYERGTDNIPWTEDDLTDWTQTGTDTAKLSYDSENGRIVYNPTKPGAGYSAEKTFAAADNALVAYDVDWYFGASTGRISNFEYIQFGSALRIGYTTDTKGGYYTYVSTDGGNTWNDLDGDGTNDSIFNGKNETYTKNIKLEIDNSSKKIVSFSFGGQKLSAYSNYALPESAETGSVSFGLQWGGSTNDWEYPNGIHRIKVSQFIPGDEIDDPEPADAVSIASINGRTANISVSASKDSAVRLVGALYDTNGTFKGVVTKDIEYIAEGDTVNEEITFGEDIEGNILKAMLWGGENNMEPLCVGAAN